VSFHLLFFFFSYRKEIRKEAKEKEACPQAGRWSRLPAPTSAVIKLN